MSGNCPKCGSHNTSQSTAELGDDSCQVYWHCDSCGLDWHRNYTYEGDYTTLKKTIRLEGGTK
jgi:transcription elongation factor Elf1